MCVCVCVCVSVCVREREREKERNRKSECVREGVITDSEMLNRSCSNIAFMVEKIWRSCCYQ